MSNSLLNQMGSALLDQIAQELKKLAPALEELWLEVKNFGDSFTKGNVTVVNEEFIDKNKLVSIVKEKMVQGANEVCVWRQTAADGEKIIYIAYAKDRELISDDKNMYVNIKFKFMSQDLEQLFDGKELIILK